MKKGTTATKIAKPGRNKYCFHCKKKLYGKIFRELFIDAKPRKLHVKCAEEYTGRWYSR